MTGETDLKILLVTMQPIIHTTPYVFCSVSPDRYIRLSLDALCTFREQEGITVIAAREQAENNSLEYDGLWACITLTVHSSLSAVGFLAAITTRLAQAGISVNVVSAYYHDHLFVPWERRGEVMEILNEIITDNKF